MTKNVEVQPDIYWNPNETLSYNRYITMVVGARGIGKTYSFKKYLIQRFLKHGEEFIYLRRYKSHLRGGVVSNFFNKVAVEFPDHKFSVKGNEFFIDGKKCGVAIPLSSWQQNKGTEFDRTHTIFYDEFLKEKDNSHYLDNEPQALISMAESVFREKIIFGTENVRIVCAANSTTIANPFFIYFKTFPDIKKRFNTFSNNKEILIEIPNMSAFTEKKLEGRFGELIKNTSYVDVSVNNNFAYDTSDFIMKRTKKTKYKFSIRYDGFTLGIWIDIDKQLMFLSQAYDLSNKKVYVFSKNDYTEHSVLVTNYRDEYEVLRMVTAFKNGQLRFENTTVRNIGFDILSRLGIK